MLIRHGLRLPPSGHPELHGAASGLGYERIMILTIACAFDEEGLAAFADAPVADQADILILPELFDGGYAALAEDGRSPEPMIERFADLTRRRKLHLIAGSLALPDAGGRIGNTSLVFSRGEIVGRFTKTHLFRPLGDDRYFAAGRPGDLVTLDCAGTGLRCGVIICYDLRFPEMVRPWFKAGIDLLAVPARWPRVRDEIWRVLLQARAIENQCFVVGVDSRDAEGGGSYAYAPEGEPIWNIGPDPEAGEPLWHQFTIDTAAIGKVKARLDTREDAILL